VYAIFEDKDSTGAKGYLLTQMTHEGEVGWNKWYRMGTETEYW